MATTGTYLFNPDIARAFDEAFEDAGMDPAGIGQAHITSALRSCERMLNSEWSTFGMARSWTIVSATHTVSAGVATFTLPAGALDVFNAMCRRNGADTQMYPISRSDYDTIAKKDSEGRPTQYFVNKRFNQIDFTMWQEPTNNTDVIVYDYFRQVSDVGSMGNTLEMPAVAYDCFVTGLSMRLALKYGSRERYNELKMLYGGPAYPIKYEGRIFQMRAETAERADATILIPRGRRR